MLQVLPQELIDLVFSYLPSVDEWCASTTDHCHHSAACRSWRRQLGCRLAKCRRWSSRHVYPFYACAVHISPRKLEALCNMHSATVIAMEDLLRTSCTYLHVHPETVRVLGDGWPRRLFLPHSTVSSRMCCEGTGLKVYRNAFARMMEWAEDLEEEYAD